jgi:hypothetical protein
MTKKSLIVTTMLVGVSLLSGSGALAQDSSDDVNLFRRDVRSLKKQIAAANMDLTDTEAQQVWRIYDRPLWVAGWNPQDAEACRHAFVEIRRAGDRSALAPHLMEYSLGTPRYCDRLGASPDAPPPNGQPPRSRAA